MGANIKDRDVFVYFLYSDKQNQDRTAIDKKMSKVFTPGTVVVNGKKKIFTEISKKSSNSYSDCIVVASGLKSKMVYTNIKSV